MIMLKSRIKLGQRHIIESLTHAIDYVSTWQKCQKMFLSENTSGMIVRILVTLHVTSMHTSASWLDNSKIQSKWPTPVTCRSNSRTTRKLNQVENHHHKDRILLDNTFTITPYTLATTITCWTYVGHAPFLAVTFWAFPWIVTYWTFFFSHLGAPYCSLF